MRPRVLVAAALTAAAGVGLLWWYLNPDRGTTLPAGPFPPPPPRREPPPPRPRPTPAAATPPADENSEAPEPEPASEPPDVSGPEPADDVAALAAAVRGVSRAAAAAIAADHADRAALAAADPATLTCYPRIGPTVARRLVAVAGADRPSDLLRGLPGLGPALCRRIDETLGDVPAALRVREEDLRAIPGIGAALAARIRARLDHPEELLAA